jgi:hypothetical protein
VIGALSAYPVAEAVPLVVFIGLRDKSVPVSLDVGFQSTEAFGPFIDVGIPYPAMNLFETMYPLGF